MIVPPGRIGDLADVVEDCRYLGIARVGQESILYAGNRDVSFFRITPTALEPLPIPPIDMTSLLEDAWHPTIRQVGGEDLAHLWVSLLMAFSTEFGQHVMGVARYDGQWVLPQARPTHTELPPQPYLGGAHVAPRECLRHVDASDCEDGFTSIGDGLGATPHLITNPKGYRFLAGFRTFASGEAITLVNFYSPAQMWERHMHFDRPDLDRPVHRKLSVDSSAEWEPSIVGERPDDLWLHWGDDLQHFDGKSWLPARLPSGEAKGGMLLLPGGPAGPVFVSKSGRVYRLQPDRQGVEEWKRPYFEEIVAGAGFELGSPWIVSSGGNVERWSGTSWMPVAFPQRVKADESRIEDVYALSPDDHWLMTVSGERRSLASTKPRRRAFRCLEPEDPTQSLAAYLPASEGCKSLRLLLRDDVSEATKAQYEIALRPYKLEPVRETYSGTSYLALTPSDYRQGEAIRTAISDGVAGYVCLAGFSLLGAPPAPAVP